MTSEPSPLPRHIPRQAELLPDLVQAMDHAVSEGRPADESLRGLFQRHHEFGSRDRRLFGSAVFSWFRWKGWLDRFEHENPWPARVVLAHALDAEDTLDPAVLYLAENVGLDISELCPAGAASLPEKARLLNGWLDGEEPPEPSLLLPEWVQAMLAPPLQEPDVFQELLATFQVRPPTWLRLRSADPAATLRELREQGLTPEAHPLLQDAVSIPGSSRLPGGSLARQFTVQDLASQVVGRVCDPQPREHWWDACAGSGGKAFLLGDLMKGRGQVDATDVRRASIDEFRKRLKQSGLQGLRAQVRDAGEKPAKRVPYDGVLLDAPCTGMGTWARNPDARWRLDPEMVERKAAQQVRLLQGVAGEVKPGGVLVYAVCTLTEAETLGVVEAFQAKAKDFRPDPFPHPLDASVSGATIWIHPGRAASNGMFIARFRRVS